MVPETTRHPSWRGRGVKIIAVNPGEQERRLREAVARRAYELFENQGCLLGHAGEDWRRAESDLVHPLACGLLARDDKIAVSTDISVFDEGIVEVCVEPRRLSLCGRPRTRDAGGACPLRQFVYRVLDLPVEVDPSQVHARFNGRILEIDLYRTPLSARAA
jgi:HSP20 family molecular chaperone IbpA